jgi:hypothetical protein
MNKTQILAKALQVLMMADDLAEMLEQYNGGSETVLIDRAQRLAAAADYLRGDCKRVLDDPDGGGNA